MPKDVAVERIKPTLYLTEKDLAKIKSMKVNQGYDFIIHAKMTSMSIGDEMHEMTKAKSKKPMTSGRFEIVSIEAPEGPKNINEEDFTDKKLKRLEQKSQE